MAVSLAFSICVMFSLKQRPELSYTVHALFQSFLYHRPCCSCLIVSATEHGSVDISRLPEWFRWKKEPTIHEASWSNQEANPNLITSTFHDFHPLILKHFCSFKPHGEVAFWLILMETSQERVFSDVQIQAMSWSTLKIPWYLAVFQPTSEFWGQMAITMIFLQPQRAQTNMSKPSRLSSIFF